MFLLVTLVGVFAGSVYAGRVNRHFALRDRRRWALLVPIWVVYGVVLLVADTRELGSQLVQAVAIGAFSATVADVVAGSRRGHRAGDARQGRDSDEQAGPPTPGSPEPARSR